MQKAVCIKLIVNPCFSIIGIPSPEVTWTKNGEPIKSDDHVKVSIKEGVSKVTIKKSTEKDSGEYAISASNKGGKVYHALSIHVTKKEAPK